MQIIEGIIRNEFFQHSSPKTCAPICNTNVSRDPPLWVAWESEINRRGTWAGETELIERRMEAYRHGRWPFRI